MCQHRSIHDYCLRTNLINWGKTCLFVAGANWLAHDRGDFTTIWAAGAGWGILLMWASEMMREWAKTWSPKGGVL